MLPGRVRPGTSCESSPHASHDSISICCLLGNTHSITLFVALKCMKHPIGTRIKQICQTYGICQGDHLASAKLAGCRRLFHGRSHYEFEDMPAVHACSLLHCTGLKQTSSMEPQHHNNVANIHVQASCVQHRTAHKQTGLQSRLQFAQLSGKGGSSCC